MPRRVGSHEGRAQELLARLKSFTLALVSVLDELVVRWMFSADVVYPVLPIGLILLIKHFTDPNENWLYLSVEWSFPTIVFFGVGLTTLIKLKAQYQNDLGYRVYVGVRIFVVLLVFSAVVLVLVVVREDLPFALNESGLSLLQIALFGASLLLTLFPRAIEEDIVKARQNLPLSMPTTEYYYFLIESLSALKEGVERSRRMMLRGKEMEFRRNASAELKMEVDARDEEARRRILEINKITRQIQDLTSQTKRPKS